MKTITLLFAMLLISSWMIAQNEEETDTTTFRLGKKNIIIVDDETQDTLEIKRAARQPG